MEPYAHIFSGGEIRTPEKEEYLDLARRLKNQEDVHELIALSKQPSGKWLYFIRTPFASLPKFIVGETDFETLEDPIIHLRSGQQWPARDKWDELNGGPF